MFAIDNKKLIDVLVEEGKVKPDFAASCRNLNNQDLEGKLKSENIISSYDIARSYAHLYHLPYVSLANLKLNHDVLAIIPKSLAEKFKIIPYGKQMNREGQYIIKVAIADPGRLSNNLQDALKDLEQKKHLKIDLAIATMADFEKAILQYKDIPQELQSPAAPPVQNIPVQSQASPQVQSKPQQAVKPPPQPVYQPPKQSFQAIDLDKVQIPFEVICKFPEDIARKYRMVVFESPHPSFIKVAVADPNDKKVREILHFVREKNDIAIQEFQATPAQITRAMKFYKKPAPLPPQQVVKVNPKPEPQKVAPPVAPPAKPQPVESKKETGPQKFILKPRAEKVPEAPKEKQKEETKEVKNAPVPSAPQTQAAAKEQKQQEEEQQPQVQLVDEENLDKFLTEDIKTVDDLNAVIDTGNVPKIVAASIVLAVGRKASDIHIEPEKKDLRIRFRIDGILRDVSKTPVSLQPAIISRIKILSKLKIDETRVPQDGRFDVTTKDHAIDLRVSTLPTVHGEKVAMRILDKSAHIYTMEELGLIGRNLKVVVENIAKPYGVILSTGPTGSGKTTTLYAILNRISNASVNIVTLEDPVEYEMPGLNQCQIKPKIGFTFANGLRSVLRQDPNIIMVGEIRDSETASLATHAALTGHLVLSTLHTNDAAGALPRVINMGVEPFLITSSVNAIIAQRLVRKLCPKCVRPAHIPEPIMKEIEQELKGFNLPTPYQFLEGKGCSYCENGYRGRIGIFEVLDMTDTIESLVIAKKPASDIKNEAIKEGMITMKQDGLMKAIKGVTTVNEVLRVITV